MSCYKEGTDMCLARDEGRLENERGDRQIKKFSIGENMPKTLSFKKFWCTWEMLLSL